MKYVTITLALGLIASPSTYAEDDKASQTENTTTLQKLLANKKCETGTPAIKEVVKTVPKMVAGRMVPTSIREAKVVCL
ncbi:hypothetical protein [Kordiimonas aquimaris]|uniref:hypothetical protein n=1 Tax=Kordiimonas aquimaris TaxID=707591 RepID=UPI0021D020C5|nr:hypothetical protein [Kordiimonas aquimaris]